MATRNANNTIDFGTQFGGTTLTVFDIAGATGADAQTAPGQDMENMQQGMVSIFLSQAIKNKKISIKGSLSRFRDFIYIDDVVECWFRASFCESALNQAINLGRGEKTTVNELVEIIKSITQVDEINIKEGTPCDQLGIYSDTTKLKKILNLKPKVDLINGLKYFYEWAIKQ